MEKQTVVTFVTKGELYEEFEDDLKNILHDNQVELEYVRIREYPWKDVYHEVIWWITRKLNLKEWSELDSVESEAISKIVGDWYFGRGDVVKEIDCPYPCDKTCHNLIPASTTDSLVNFDI